MLSTDKIWELMHDQNTPPENRLIITPILDWGKQAKKGQSAVDLRLGQLFVVPSRTKIAELNHLDENHEEKLQQYKDEYYVLLGDHFVLHPRQFVLGQTLEWVHLPRDFGAYVIGRSSWGRDGLIIATAIGVHAGYSGVLTLEISNVGEIPIRLYPGLTIAQLFVHRMEILEGIEPDKGRFASSPHAASMDAVDADEKEIVRKLSKKRGYSQE
ncbi:MAG: dCTP deaminase [Candidatus Hydrogenedentes bacterium]|nr:dCTP deaminase [Candidatus Hydrogenedentota bacterium]